MSILRVEIDKMSGFCFGVVYSIQVAEFYLKNNKELYCLGDIVHNDEEIKRLESKGLKIINYEDLKTIKNTKVLLRAHGESPEIYEIAFKNNIEIIDASCPVVLKLQNKVKKTSDSCDLPIFIYGKHGHSEVKGLIGQVKGKATVFQDLEELKNIKLPPRLVLFSQTTKNKDSYNRVKEYLKDECINFICYDTVCSQVSNRHKELSNFVKRFDKIIFVAGKKSSNGRVLYNVCKKNNKNSHFISTHEEIQKEWFEIGDKVGICGATSTPMWLMENIKKLLTNNYIKH